MLTTRKLIYAIAFQVGWFVCILTGNWVSLAYTVLFLAFHFFFLKYKAHSTLLRKEALWIASVFVGGLILETLSFSAGFLYAQTPSNLFAQLILPPIWLLNLWLVFAIALRTCLSFIFYKPKVSYLVSSVAIPLNYYAGVELNNNVAISNPYSLSLALITLMWIVLLWLLTQLKRYYFEDIFNAG
jgi:hypothetical protein